MPSATLTLKVEKGRGAPRSELEASLRIPGQLMDQARAVLLSRKRQGRHQPIVRVLMPDGRITEFKDRGIVVADSATEGDTENGDAVFAILVNGQGDLFVFPNGEPAVVGVPVWQLGAVPDPDKLVSYKQVAKLLGVSLSTVKRKVADGELPKPVKVGKRKVAFLEADVRDAIAKKIAR